MASISVGPSAIDRADNTAPGNYTIIFADNPANAAGTVGTIEFYMYTAGNNIKVGLFYSAGGGSYTCRSACTIGTVAAGSLVTKTTDSGTAAIALAVSSGDLLGVYAPTGAFEAVATGAGGIYWVSGDKCTAGTSAAYTLSDGDAYSLHGIGVTSASGWANISKVHGVTATDTSKFYYTAVADIAKVFGVSV